MSFQIFSTNDPIIERELPERSKYVLDEAISSKRDIIKIVWEGPDYPEHAQGYIQWSIRPYLVSDKCDGTRDSCCQLVTMLVCRSLGIDPDLAYREAYSDEPERLKDFYTSRESYLNTFLSQVIIPEINSLNLKYLIRSIYDMNYRSLAYILLEKFEALGFEIGNFWEI